MGNNMFKNGLRSPEKKALLAAIGGLEAAGNKLVSEAIKGSDCKEELADVRLRKQKVDEAQIDFDNRG